MDDESEHEGQREQTERLSSPTCERCGGSLRAEDGTSLLRCPYCGDAARLAPAVIDEMRAYRQGVGAHLAEADQQALFARAFANVSGAHTPAAHALPPAELIPGARCAVCGGPNSFGVRATFATCSHCGASLVATAQVQNRGLSAAARVARAARLRAPRFVVLLLAALASGCGKTSDEPGSGSATPPQVVCSDTLPARELSLLSDDSTDAAMGSCGELSYARSGQVYLADSSLSQVQLLEGATALPTFDPRGQGVFYLKDESRTLVYRDLRGENRWSAVLPSSPLQVVDFYSKSGASGLFRCEGESIVDYDATGNATRHDLGLHCPNALYSGLDALLLGPGRDGYVSVTLGTWQMRALEDAGSCNADSCEMSLIRRVLRKQALVGQLMGDYFAPVPAGAPRYYDGESGTELRATALVPPDRHVVAATGHPIYLAEDLTAAITDDSHDGRDETVLRYFGPNPGQPERWFTSSLVLVPRRASLRALPARGFERVAVWSEDCAEGSPRTQLTFVPGSSAEPLDIDGCVLRVHWVGSDGTLLAQVWLDGTDWPSVYGAPLALIRPDSRLDLLDIDVHSLQGVRQVLSNARTLAISTGYGGPLYVVDLETAASREAAPAADRLLTDHSRERLAFRASYGPGPGALWAGAFPR